MNGIQSQRPDQILENPYKDKSAGPLAVFINPAAFAQSALGTYGKVGYRTVEGPSTWQFDVALSRIFRTRETQRLEFRAEGYNLLNSFRPQNPATNFTTANTFGVIRNSFDPRIMQFVLKYIF